jgi:hypothetical protein
MEDNCIILSKGHKCRFCQNRWHCSECLVGLHILSAAPSPCPPCHFQYSGELGYSIIALTDTEATYEEFGSGRQVTYSYRMVDDFECWVAKVRKEAGV